LKYFKNLSLLHLHFSQSENASFPQREISLASQKLRALSKNLRKISGLPKMKIKLSFSLVQTRNEEFLMSLKRFSKLESFTSVDMALNEYDFSGIKETILSFKKSKSLSQISMTLDECIPHPQDPQTGFHELKTGFKEIKSLKDLRIDLQTDCGITSSNFKELVPIFKEIGEFVNLKMIFVTSSLSLNLAFVKEMPSLRRKSSKINAKFPGLLLALFIHLSALIVVSFMSFNVFMSRIK